MPDALSFRNREALVTALRRRSWENDFRDLHALRPDLGPLTAIHTAVSSSTFRAFRKHGSSQPSVVFREWASEVLFKGHLERLFEVRSNNAYRHWAKSLAKRLDKQWRREFRHGLDLPRGLKLINLLAKGLCVVCPLWPVSYKKIVPHLDVPLDKYSLRPLASLEELHHLNLRRASMGSVRDFNEYAKIQGVIRDICRKAQVPPIAYDFLSWNGPHTGSERKKS